MEKAPSLEEQAPSSKMLLLAKKANHVATHNPVSHGIGKLHDTVWEIPSMVRKPKLGVQQHEVHAPQLLKEETEDNQLALPPDEMLKSMNIIMRKRLNGVSIQEFYEICWSEKESFYRLWLVDDGKIDVQVGEWEFSHDEDFIGDWDNETYPQRRVVRYCYKRDPKTLGYSLGKPQVFVTQTQYCRTQGNDRSVLAITMEMDGEPFADSFKVLIRGVSTRVGENDMSIDFGVFVYFTKQIIVANNIRRITISATAESMLDLFNRMKKACGSEEVEWQVVEEKETAAESVACDLCLKCHSELFSFCFPFLIHKKVFKDDIDQATYDIRQKLDLVLALPAGDVSEEKYANQRYVRSEFLAILDALDSILTRENMKPAERDKTDGCTSTINEPSDSGFKHPLSFFRRPYRFHSRSTNEVREASSTLPSDEILFGMNVIISEVLDGSVKDFYYLFSEQGSDTYASWLNNSGRRNVKVGEWEFSKESNGDLFIEDWSKEGYQQKRTVTFEYELTTKSVRLISELVQGSPIIHNTETHYCYLEGNNKCVFAVTSKSDDSWFSGFNVQTRWVVTQVKIDKISVKVGMFVLTRKKTRLLPQKIVAEATKSVTKQQREILQLFKTALGVTPAHSMTPKVFACDEEETNKGNPLVKCFPCPWMSNKSVYPGSLIASDDELRNQVSIIESRLRAVDRILSNIQDPGQAQNTENMNFYLSQLIVIREALDDIITWHGDLGNESHALAHGHLVVGLS